VTAAKVETPAAPVAARPAAPDGYALAFAMLFPSLMAWLYFVALAGEGGAGPGLMIVFGAGKVVQFAFPAVYVWWFERQRLRPAWPSARGLTVGLGFGLLVGAAVLGLYHGWLRHSPLTAQTPEKVVAKLRQFHCDSPAGYLGVAVFYSVFHSLLEEYYWRWFVFGWLRRYLSLPAALLLSGLAFMGHHVVVLAVYFPGRFWTLALPLSLGVGIGGVVWAWLYERTRSLYAAWVSHLLIDAAIMVVGYEMVSRYW
jgi:membrane protease YdiL (CAAX protease family)